MINLREDSSCDHEERAQVIGSALIEDWDDSWSIKIPLLLVVEQLLPC